MLVSLPQDCWDLPQTEYTDSCEKKLWLCTFQVSFHVQNHWTHEQPCKTVSKVAKESQLSNQTRKLRIKNRMLQWLQILSRRLKIDVSLSWKGYLKLNINVISSQLHGQPKYIHSLVFITIILTTLPNRSTEKNTKYQRGPSSKSM